MMRIKKIYESRDKNRFLNKIQSKYTGEIVAFGIVNAEYRVFAHSDKNDVMDALVDDFIRKQIPFVGSNGVPLSVNYIKF